MKQSITLLAILSFMFTPASSLFGRVFTDLEGRSTEADLAGVSGQDIILRKSGVEMRWPLSKLSPADQAYVNEWKASPPETPKLGVQIWKKEGFSTAGTFADEPGAPDGLPHVPGIHEVNKKDKFHHFAVDITNPGPIQANLLTLSYQVYIIPTSGPVIVETATEVVPSIDMNKRVSLVTKSISTSRTKTTTLTLGTNAFGNLTTGQQSRRDSERSGGVWVRVYSHDGKMVGEASDLTPQIQMQKPVWVAPTRSTAPKLEGGLEGFDQFVTQVRDKLAAIQAILETKPPLPGADTEKDKPAPPTPPFLR